MMTITTQLDRKPPTMHAPEVAHVNVKLPDLGYTVTVVAVGPWHGNDGTGPTVSIPPVEHVTVDDMYALLQAVALATALAPTLRGPTR